MRITAITRYKHGELYQILRRLRWTQSELARRTEMREGTIGDIINLRRRPSAEQANKIQEVVGEAGQYLDVLSEWPESFALERGHKVEQTAEVPMEQLLGNREAMMLPAPDSNDTTDLDSAVESLVSGLSEREGRVIKGSFYDGKRDCELVKEMKISKERVRQIKAKALRKLRHPSRLSKIVEHR